MFRDYGDKLERHEYRERQLGEQMKKALGGLDKRHRNAEASLESLRDMVNKIDSRIRTLEESDKLQTTNNIPMDTIIARMELTAARIEAAIAKSETPTTAIPLVTTTPNNKENEELKALADTSAKQAEQLERLRNETNQNLQMLRYDIVSSQEKGVNMVNDRINEVVSMIERGHEDVSKSASEAGEIAESACSEVSREHENMLSEIKALSKMDQILVQTADNVLDAKRRIEFGSHHVVLELSELVRAEAMNLNETIQNKFNAITSAIMDNQSGALGNLTTKLETEMNQVWRQIGIMYQQLSNSAGALHRLQEQTDAYVNGSLATMDNMQGKVVTITSRMAEVDENLNYLLGRLSLVTQDFSQIKSGLTRALDDIRSSFMAVQKKITTVGGRNPITSEEAAAGALPEDPTGLNPPKPPLEDVENQLTN